MSNAAAESASNSTIARSDVEWTATGEKPCACGHCLVCEVEAMAGPSDAAEIEAEVIAAQFDNDPNPYAGNDDDGGFCGDDY
jgi:hypothetical protein